MVGQTLYYGEGSGSFTLTAAAADGLSGLDRLTFPATTAPGQTFDFAGELTAEESLTYVFSATSTFSNTVPVTATDRAGNITPTLAAIFNDNVAPTVALTVPTSAGLDFSVAWAATDAASGVRAFNLGYGSSASGPWTAWLTATTDLSAAFLGLPDESYYFRVQAVDNVGNVSSWLVEGPVTINTVTKYYDHGGQRVAMRQGDAVYYLSGDHLGSTSLTTDSAGQVVHEARYLPYGQERWSSGAGVTDYTYTGQRVEAGFGLYDYNARFYSGRLGRFISADTLVPEPKNPQAFNRYGYAYNNPIRYNDPSGHGPCDIPGFPCEFFDPLQEMWDDGQRQTGQAAYDAQQAAASAAQATSEFVRDLPKNYVIASANSWWTLTSAVEQLREPLHNAGEAIYTASTEPPDALIFGANGSYVIPNNFSGTTTGIEGVINLTSGETSLFTYDGLVDGPGAGGSIDSYVGIAWNLAQNKDYRGSFESITFNVATPEGGGNLTVFWGPPFSSGSVFGFAVGPSVGGEISITHTSTFYKERSTNSLTNPVPEEDEWKIPFIH